MIKIRIGRWLFLLGLLPGLLYPAEGASQTPISLEFKSQATVQKETIYLGDLATIQGSPLWVAEKIGRLKIQASPLPGEILILSRDALASKIARNGLTSLVPQLQIPEEIEVSRQGRFVERGEMIRVLENHLQGILGDEKKTVRVKEIQGHEKVVIPTGPLSWEIKVPDRFYQGGSLAVSLAPLVEGQKAQEVRLHARVEIYADVVVARHSLPRHQIVTEKDVYLANKNITLHPSDVLTNLEEVLGKRMTLSLNGQEILRKSMVDIPPLVKKGDRVVLLVEKDHFRITTLGEVKEEGREGDQIRVINISSKKEIYGRVVDGHTVRVDF